ncbi:MAG TPA: flavin reductase family protein [Ktedonobacteraceae bacterium]|nr:flavin reductase family protein [Ktedonobacteraceae bacterium]
MAIEKDFFRQVAGQFATGVTIVTTQDHGTPTGITVNAFCSVSLDPLLVLVCIDLKSTTLPCIRDSGIFAVNILSNEQEYLSRCFATTTEERYAYFCHASFHTAATGAPIIDDVLAFIDARVVAEYPGGDHVIFVGQVEAMGDADQIAFARDEARQHASIIDYRKLQGTEEKPPLAYYRGKYRHLTYDYLKPSLA